MNTRLAKTSELERCDLTNATWTALEPLETSGWGVCVSDENEIICQLRGRNASKKKQRAALIAAAPEMLSMLKKMWLIEANPEISNELVHLIRKAENKIDR